VSPKLPEADCSLKGNSYNTIMAASQNSSTSQQIETRITENIAIRSEHADDIASIRQLIEAAFKHAVHTSHTEQFIVDGLRRAGQLSLSLVAVEDDRVVGHVAVSPVTISSGASGWYGLGPISVAPNRQAQGIGSMLMKAALVGVQALGGNGCVVLGDPSYYRRFGFRVKPGLELSGVPQEYFQVLSFSTELPMGSVQYHLAFDAAE
jgi:predicted N-acetyltransferase YhbS